MPSDPLTTSEKFVLKDFTFPTALLAHQKQASTVTPSEVFVIALSVGIVHIFSRCSKSSGQMAASCSALSNLELLKLFEVELPHHTATTGMFSSNHPHCMVRTPGHRKDTACLEFQEQVTSF